MGALIIFWMISEVSPLIFTPSKTVAWRTPAKLLMMSGRLSRAVRAATAEVLESGMKPTCFSDSGTRKCKWRQRVETPINATSSILTPRFFAIFSAMPVREILDVLLASDSMALAMRSNSEARLRLVVMRYPLGSRRLPGGRGQADTIPSYLHLSDKKRVAQRISSRACPRKEQAKLQQCSQLLY